MTHAATNSIMSIGMLVGMFFAMAMYFVPAIIAFVRGKANRMAILALNFLAGWTFIGWVGALVWALTKDQRTAVEKT